MHGTASFKPVAADDLAQAVKFAQGSNLSGQFAVRGTTPVTVKQLLSLVEQACGKQPGQTVAMRQLPMLPPFRMLEEFLFGMAIDTNMAEMVNYFNQNQEEPVIGQDFWQKAGIAPGTNLDTFFQKRNLSDSEDSLVLPTFGSYKLGCTD